MLSLPWGERLMDSSCRGHACGLRAGCVSHVKPHLPTMHARATLGPSLDPARCHLLALHADIAPGEQIDSTHVMCLVCRPLSLAHPLHAATRTLHVATHTLHAAAYASPEDTQLRAACQLPHWFTTLPHVLVFTPPAPLSQCTPACHKPLLCAGGGGGSRAAGVSRLAALRAAAQPGDLVRCSTSPACCAWGGHMHNMFCSASAAACAALLFVHAKRLCMQDACDTRHRRSTCCSCVELEHIR